MFSKPSFRIVLFLLGLFYFPLYYAHWKAFDTPSLHLLKQIKVLILCVGSNSAEHKWSLIQGPGSSFNSEARLVRELVSHVLKLEGLFMGLFNSEGDWTHFGVEIVVPDSHL